VVYGYEAATLSMEHASEADAHNDWDLEFGNDQEPGADWFTVNMVVDDRSFVVDVGALASAADAPEVVDPTEHMVGAFGAADDIPVVVGHTYVVRTLDDSTRQYAIVRVLAHVPDDHVDLRWCRSPDPDRFVPPPGC
jgi:hypothetical protein